MAPTEKTCSKCGVAQARTNFCKGKRFADGYQPWCKSCMKVAAREYYYRYPERLRERARQYGKAHRAELTAKTKQRRRENPEKFRQWDMDRYRRDKAKRIAYTKLWASLNPEKRRQYCRKWDAENVDNKRAHAQKRQAIKMRAVPGWASVEAIKAIFAEARRLELETGGRYDVDHIVPLQSPLVCGLHWEGNLRVTTMFENRSKNNRAWPDMPEPERLAA